MTQNRTLTTISDVGQLNDKLKEYISPDDNLSLLLDYDGTLAKIVTNPNETAMPPELETSLRRLSDHPKVFMAIISGRSIEDVQKKVNIKNITYVGNHGIEIQNPNGTRQDYQLPENIQKSYRQLVTALNQKLSKNGAWVEDKKVSLTYHYNKTPASMIDAQRHEAIEIIERHGFKANQAHFAIEAKPPVNWNKGEAALFILRNKFGDNWPTKTKVIFAGDDTTDEDAMKALQGNGKSFRISSDAAIHTYADFRLPRQTLVTDLIRWIAETYS